MPPKFLEDERSADTAHTHIVEELKTFSTAQFAAGELRMAVIEESLGRHTKILEDNAKLTIALGDRFDTFESSLQVERRLKDAALAQSLDEWKNFTILKFDESTGRQNVIESNQKLHMEATAELQTGIGTLLTIVSTLEGVKKTAGKFGRCGMWIGERAGKIMLWAGGLAAAFVAIRTALVGTVKAPWWPWV